MRTPPPRALVLGLGNLLMGDDGVGIAALRRLQERFAIAAEVDLVDGGTMGMYLLDRVARYERLLVVDSIAVDEPPGTLIRVADQEVDAVFSACLSPHQTGVNDLLAALTLLERRPSEVVVVGIVPADLGVGTELSEPVAVQLDRLVDRLEAELRAWGYVVTERP